MSSDVWFISNYKNKQRSSLISRHTKEPICKEHFYFSNKVLNYILYKTFFRAQVTLLCVYLLELSL